jgi:hypothetical protein
MNTVVAERLRRIGAWCGIAYCVTILLGWGVFAGFLPPHKPTATPEEIAQIFREDAVGIRIGMLFVMLAALCMIPFGAAIAQALSQIEGRVGMLAFCGLIGSVGNMVLTFYPATWWLVAAYRPDRGADLVYLMNDIGWLQFIGGVTMYLALPLSMAIAAFVDDRAHPILPRWAGYLNVWVCILIIPDQLLFFFQIGPFAWNGLFGLWLPVIAFFGWFLSTVYLLLRPSASITAPDAAAAPREVVPG